MKLLKVPKSLNSLNFDHFNIRFFKFIVIGILNTIVGYSLYAFMIWNNLNYVLASGLATILGVIFNYFSTGKIVFSNNNARLLSFISVYILIYSIQVGGISVLLLFNLNTYTSGLIMILPLSVIAYQLNSKYVFINYE